MREFEDMIKRIGDDAKRMFAAQDFLLDVCEYDIKDPLYIHSMDVAARCTSDRTRTVALLHDIVEDTSVTIDDIEKRFGHDIARAVYILTRREGYTYLDYIAAIVVSKDRLAIEVKKADLEDHLAKTDTLSESLKERYDFATRLLTELA